ncbi:U7 snRNA-associated Sm-like protein LSm10 [Sitophilus oryzae]|uniref:U7 snRNA-associated Sm-like protein LSm10 n=1 Tax=Sitophilus oryzae TaxID=7048 RepID=A0A6J2XP69_SITOR|nr:U7 snRNA-associated Sm-like protein LSm10 [Sitophilus oryzae]
MAIARSDVISKKEKYFLYNTLSGLVKGMENSYTTIDLRNECCVTGKITKVDAFMNVEMEDVICYDMTGNKTSLESFFLCARNIRYVHISPQKDVATLLNEVVAPMIPKKGPPKRSFKNSRAQKQNAKTIAEAYNRSRK